MKARTVRRSGWLATILAGLLTLGPAFSQVTPKATDETADQPTVEPAENPAFAGARIVRLSQSRGDVKMDRAVGHGFETAFANLPVVQGAKIKTSDGVAEVEFEDNSSLRIVPNSTVEFKQLARDSAGNTVTSVNVLHGGIYVSLSDARVNTFSVTGADGRVALAPASHIQFQTGVPSSTVAVYKGNVQAQLGSSLLTVDQKKTLTFATAGTSQPQIANHLEKGQYDEWDRTAVSYQKQFMNSSRSLGFAGGSGVRSGAADLHYYGNFSSAGGCGSLWRPYFAGAGFSPYANGVYAQYAGGYSWVSPYPWGWLPYHSGSWQYCSGSNNWGWQPGSNFVGLANNRMAIRPGVGPVRVGPPQPPKQGEASFVAVHQLPLPASKVTGGNIIVFAKDSAGIGIPRQTFGNLQHASSHLEQHGSAIASASWAPGSASSGGSSSSSASGRSASTGQSAALSGHSSSPSSGISGGGSHSSGGGGMSSGGGASSGGGHH